MIWWPGYTLATATPATSEDCKRNVRFNLTINNVLDKETVARRTHRGLWSADQLPASMRTSSDLAPSRFS